MGKYFNPMNQKAPIDLKKVNYQKKIIGNSCLNSFKILEYYIVQPTLKILKRYFFETPFAVYPKHIFI